MKARIKFQKFGSMKFVGHLDIMRYFQKAFRRADIDSEYTKGFSPHQIMSFAAPLGVGLTSDSEYLDVQLFSCDSPQEMIDRINSVVTEGFRITCFHPLLEREEDRKAVTAMSLVAAADYLVSLKEGYHFSDSIRSKEEFAKAFSTFMQSAEIVVAKKTKTSEKAVNIRPMITLFAYEEEQYEASRLDKLKDDLKAMTLNNVYSKSSSVADVYDNGIKVYIQVDTGSSVNLKPELVMEAFSEYMEVTYNKFAWQVHRLEIYTKDTESGKLAALNQVER